MIELYSWLAKKYEASEEQIKEVLKNEKASSFLIIWSIFEQKCFEGFFRKDKICSFSQIHFTLIQDPMLSNIAKDFYERYQDKTKYQKLRHGDVYLTADEILTKKYDTLSQQEQFTLLLYVIYRFRNNIFHGNKNVMSWLRSSGQIEQCLKCMMIILDSKY